MSQQDARGPGARMVLTLFPEISYIYLDQYSPAMNLKKQKRNLLIALFICALCPIAGQAVYDLDFQGVLHDIDGNRVANESFNLNVQLKKPSGSDIWFEFSSVTHSDAEGWFGFHISEISRYLIGEDPFSDPVLISLEILPNSETEWIDEGGDFELSYTLSSQTDGEKKDMEMTRMEGSKLVAHSEDHFHAFKDSYPFGYITGGFLLSDQPPVEQELINDLKQWILPESSEEEGAASRGVKGGFPTGGYYKKK